jgi:hypothetical protein
MSRYLLCACRLLDDHLSLLNDFGRYHGNAIEGSLALWDNVCVCVCVCVCVFATSQYLVVLDGHFASSVQ